MKSHYFVIIALLLSFCSNAQDQLKFNRDKVFKFKYGLEIMPCNVMGDTIPGASKTSAQKGWHAKIDKVLTSQNKVVFYFIKWKDSKNSSLEQRNQKFVYDNYLALKQAIEKKTLIKPNLERKYFFMSISEFNRYMKIVPSNFELSAGTVIVPIKIRTGNGENIPLDFYGNFNAGIGLNARLFKIINVFAGISITSVPVDAETTNNIINSATNAAALTPTFGLIKDIGNAQVGVFLGFDYLSKELGDNWIYQGRRWFGVGVGVNIFDVKLGKGNETSQKP